MTQGRKPNPAAAAVHAPMNTEALKKAGDALTELGKRSAEVAERFGDGVAYDRERIVTETKFLMSQSAEAMLEAGKRLVQIKENEPFGDFIDIVESRLGLGKRTAQVMMNAAVKYLSPALASKTQTLALLGKSKLFDLMVESDSELADLAEGGTVAGKTLDDMQAMSVRELRTALADARQTLESRQKLLDKANAKADRLKEKIDRPYVPTEESVARNKAEAEALDELTGCINGAEVEFARLAGVAGGLQASNAEAVRTRALQAVQYLVVRMRDIVLEHGLEVTVDDDALGVRPAWLDQKA